MENSTLNPAVIDRSDQEQSQVDQETANMALYYFESCPFCIRVLRTMDRLHLKIEMRNVREVSAYRQQLIQGGGRSMVPCLRIRDETGEETWMYESDDIMDYLEERFGRR